MFRNFLDPLFNMRKPLMNSNNLHDYVEVLAWHHPVYSPAQHMAIRIIKNSDETDFFSFYPVVLEDMSKFSLPKQRMGKKAFFVESYEDELLLQGFKNSWPGIKIDLTDAQYRAINGDTLKYVSDQLILETAKRFPALKQDEIRKKGLPVELYKLRYLDMNALKTKIRELKSRFENQNQDEDELDLDQDPDIDQSQPLSYSWAPLAGSYFHAEKTHNCASIVLEVLYAGGLDYYLTSSNDIMGIAGLVIAAGIFAASENHTLLTGIIELAVGFFGGRALGGVYDGYWGIQNFVNLMTAQKEDSFPRILGLRFASILVSGMVGILRPAPFSAFLTLPRDVLNLTHRAKVAEELLFNYHVERLEQSPAL